MPADPSGTGSLTFTTQSVARPRSSASANFTRPFTSPSGVKNRTFASFTNSAITAPRKRARSIFFPSIAPATKPGWSMWATNTSRGTLARLDRPPT